MNTIAKLVVELQGNSAKLRAEFSKAGKASKSWASNTRSQANAAGKAMAGIAVVGVGALSAVYANAAKSGDAMAKLSDQIGIVPEALAGLQHAAEITTTGGTEMLNKSLVKMSKSLGEAQNGTGEAVKYLDDLGLRTEAFFSLSPSKQFGEIAEKINGLATQQEKAAAASAIFGRSGGELINTMALGKEGLAAMAAEAESLGLTLNRVDLAKIEAANDAFHRAKVTTGAFGKVLAAEAAPFVEAISNQFLSAAKSAGGFGNIAKEVIDKISSGVESTSNAVHGLSVVWDGVKAASLTAIESIGSGVAWIDRRISEFIDAIPGLSASANEALQSSVGELANAGAVARENFQNALIEPMPSTKIKRWVEDVQKKATTAAQEVAKSKTTISADVETNVVGVNDKYAKDIESIRQGLLSEEDVLSESYIRRQEIINNAHLAGQLSDQHYRDLLLKNSQQYFDADAKLAAQKKVTTLSNYGELFDGLAGIVEASQGKQSGVYKAMFAASKAFSIAEAIVKIQAGIANAAATPFPGNIAAIGSVVSVTSGILTTIKSTKLQSFDGGGFTGEGSRSGGIDGRGGFAAMLHPNETVIDHTRGQKSAANITVNVIEDSNRAGEVSTNDDRIDVYVDRIRAAMIDDIHRGRGVGDAIKTKFSLTSRAGA